MPDKILIAKAEKNDNRLRIKVKNKARNGYAPIEYIKVVNVQDSNDICRFLEDLVSLFNAPVESAFRKFIDKNEKGFPF
jgi:hypothetical protein